MVICKSVSYKSCRLRKANFGGKKVSKYDKLVLLTERSQDTVLRSSILILKTTDHSLWEQCILVHQQSVLIIVVCERDGNGGGGEKTVPGRKRVQQHWPLCSKSETNSWTVKDCLAKKEEST